MALRHGTGVAASGPRLRPWGMANYLLMGALLVLFIYPFWDVLVLSFTTPDNAVHIGLRLVAFPLTVDAYKRIFISDTIFIGYYNTVLRTVVGTAILIAVTYCGAYAISKKGLPFRRTIILFFLFTLFFDGGLIATYLNIRHLGLLGSRWALILPLATSAWYLIITRNFLMTVPGELEDSAFMDGAGTVRTVFSIIAPVCAPLLAVLALWSAVGHWNAWFDALLYVSDRNKLVLQLVLRRVLTGGPSDIGDLNIQMFQGTMLETVKAATIVVTIGPIILVYPFLQRYFVKGLLIGALKG